MYGKQYWQLHCSSSSFIIITTHKYQKNPNPNPKPTQPLHAAIPEVVRCS
eukprot:m.7217 g.7217  ORF g.7217 m.7217 type:complete len:50 (+) comp2730_c0_seq1:168-317(+)